jgi:hypothetical protein
MELRNRNESNLHFSVHRDDHLKIKKHGRLFWLNICNFFK